MPEAAVEHEGQTTVARRYFLSSAPLSAAALLHATRAHQGVETRNRMALLGEPSNSTYHEWVNKTRAEAPLALPLDTMTRVSGVLGIHKALGILFPIEAEAMTWLRGPHRGEVSGGQAPLEVMVEDGLDGILSMRRYLDGWRGGLRGGPGEGAGTEPVRATDLIFT
jgi:hypothetical protein